MGLNFPLFKYFFNNRFLWCHKNIFLHPKKVLPQCPFFVHHKHILITYCTIQSVFVILKQKTNFGINLWQLNPILLEYRIWLPCKIEFL